MRVVLVLVAGLLVVSCAAADGPERPPGVYVHMNAVVGSFGGAASAR